jgi:glucokinase
MVIKDGDASAPCGCGNLGCAEAYLSGRSFARRNRTRFSNPTLKPRDIAQLARSGDPRARAAFEEYARLMGVALANYVAMFSPEIFVFTGGFAEAADLFLDRTQKELAELIKRRRAGIDLMPKLEVSSLENEAGLLGGAYVALFRK